MIPPSFPRFKTFFAGLHPRTIALLVLLSLVGSQLLYPIRISKSAPPKEHLSLVALLVDESVYSASKNYVGLSEDYNGVTKTTIRSRIDRYAEQIQETLPATKSLIIRTQPDEKPENIVHALERLYFEGDGTSDAITQLQGVVLIGEIPIPIVNKNGNRYPSLYPYTDFEERVYLFNPTTGDFERSPEIGDITPEAWHGVIRPPVSGTAGNELLAKFFDKNTLYRQGNEEFASFNEKMFYADTVAEKKVLNKEGVQAYDRFVDEWETLTYQWFTKDLARELFLEVHGSLEGGDNKDNDGDGLTDEDPVNGYDDDNDGVIDEEDGNFYYGIDNDRDCWDQDESRWDSNGDGRPCSTGDKGVDEDGLEDNNNDGDLLTDEDEPGDHNGDGCSGSCGVDEDGDGQDWDGDGWPNGWEIEVLDSKVIKRRSPFWQKPSDADLRIFETLYTDEAYSTYDPLCFTPYNDEPPPADYVNGTLKFQPNYRDRNGNTCMDPACNGNIANDDDEDGLCDEDTSIDNDADGDGQADEDRGGDKEDGGDMFADLPDIQSKKVVESFLKKYPELFKKYLGDLNQWTDFTGRYESSTTDENGMTSSERESIVGLIGQRDAYVQLFLRAVNDLLSEEIDTVVSEVANDLPMISQVTATGTVTYMHGSEKKSKNYEYTFINHSVKGRSSSNKDKMFVQGLAANEITSVGQCSLYRGSYNDGEGQLVEANRVYDYNTSGEFKEEGEEYGGCYGMFYETPEYCFPEAAVQPVRNQSGTRLVENDSIFADYRSCYNFREEEGFLGGGDSGTPQEEGYWYYATEFVDKYAKLVKALDKGKKDEGDDQDDDGDYDEDDFNLEIETIIQELNDDGAYDIPIRDVDKIYLLNPKNTDGDYLTLGAFFTALEVDKDSQEEIGGFFSGKKSYYTVNEFSFDKDMSATMTIEKTYMAEDLGDLTDDEDKAMTVSSILRHIEPYVSTINKQLAAGFSEALPIDRPRHTTFQDRNYAYQRIDYPNIYTVSSWEELQGFVQVKEDEIVQNIPGASGYDGFLTGLLGTEIFAEQVADALKWKAMNVDEKHEWVLKSYLDPTTETFVAKPEDGFESFYLVADGDTDRLNMSFYANTVGADPDIEFSGLNTETEEVSSTDVPETEEEPYDLNDVNSSHHSWFPFIWIQDIVTWVKEEIFPMVAYQAVSMVEDTEEEAVDELNSVGFTLACGSDALSITVAPDADHDGISDQEDAAPYSIDDNADGVPDGADSSLYLKLEWPEERVLYANGSDQTEVLVSVLDTNGAVNSLDSYSEVALKIASGENAVTVLTTQNVPMVDGQARFHIVSTQTEGAFSLQAVGISSNLEGIFSNTLSLSSKSQHLKLSTYEKQFSTETTTTTTTTTNDVLILNENRETVGVIHSSTGQLELLNEVDYRLGVEWATSEHPTRQVIFSIDSDVLLASYFLLPDVENVVIQSATAGLNGSVHDVRVIDGDDSDDWTLRYDDESRVEVWAGSQLAGLIEKDGGLYMKEGYVVELSVVDPYPSITNAHVPYTVTVGEKVLFQVIAGTEKDVIDMVEVEELAYQEKSENQPQIVFENQASFAPAAKAPSLSRRDSAKAETKLAPLRDVLETAFDWFSNLVLAASTLTDTDRDGLDDLSEWTITTDLNNPDTDGDSYDDYDELQSGYSPLESNAKLFTDLFTDHEAYGDVLELFTRGVVDGYSDGSFRPDQSISREEFTKLNLGAVCIDCTGFSEVSQNSIETLYSEHPFPDSDIDPTLYYCVAHSLNEALISGYKDGDYEGYYLPKNTMSRAEATKVLLETVDVSVEEDPSDSGLPWYTAYVSTAQNRGLYPEGRFVEVDTYPTETFYPWLEEQLLQEGDIKAWLEAPITRGEFTIMVGNLLQIQDCRNDDADGDGLPDNSERYNYGTSAYNTDTDYGGVDDFTELTHGQNPVNDPSDDAQSPGDDDDDDNDTSSADDDDNDDGDATSTPAGDATTDTDADGLTDVEETLYSTDPTTPDTDEGGVNDLEEILQGTDPLDASDDTETGSVSESYAEGAHVEGLQLSRDSAYVAQTLSEDVVFETLLFTKLIPADGTSQLYLKAELLDGDGKPIADDNTSIVEFVAVDPSRPYAEILRDQVRMTEGVAETELLASTVSGYFEVTARLLSSAVPVLDTTVHVYPGVPNSIDLVPEATILKSGGVSQTAVALILKDGYGNLANYEPYTVTLTVEGPASIDASLDEDLEQNGIQVTAYGGTIDFNVISGDAEGPATITATFDSISGSTAVNVYDNIQLKLFAEDSQLVADGTASTPVTVWAVLNDAATPITGFTGEVTFGLVDTLYGTIPDASTVAMIDGQAIISFTTSPVAGTAAVTATMMGFEPASALIETLPGPSHHLELSAEETFVRTGEIMDVTVKAYDANNNFAHLDSSTLVNLRVTELGESFGEPTTSSLTLSEGEGHFSVEAKSLTGPIDLVASAEGLESGIFTINAVLEISSDTVETLDPQVLFASLLGAPFGEVSKEDYWAGWFTFKGKTQASMSLLSDPNPHLRLASIDSNGALHALDPNAVHFSVVPANSPKLPTRFLIKDRLTGQILTEGVVVLSNGNFTLLDAAQDLHTVTSDGLYLQTLLDEDRYTFKNFRGNVHLLEDGNAVMRFEPDGKIQIFDSRYHLTVNEDYDALTFDVVLGETSIARLMLKQSFDEAVTVLDDHFEWEDWTLLGPGVYVTAASSERYDTETAYSGNSSRLPAGLFVVDRTESLSSREQPGLGRTSLESAHISPGVGFDGENKFMLGLADGWMVGEAYQSYPSDIGIVLGDPTIRLTDHNPQEVSSTGFTKGIGRVLLSGSDTVQDILPVDYNSDHLMDMLVAFENGEIELLENRDSYPRFDNKGTLLNLTNGIVDMTEGDFDQDGQTDLVVATQDACIEGEVCVYLYWNNNGNFIRQNLELEIDGKNLKELLAADLNQDDYPDLVVSDLNGSILSFYNVEGTLQTTGDLLGNVGMKIDSDTNLLEELMVHYDGMPAENPNDPSDDSNYNELPVAAEEGYGNTADLYSAIDPGLPTGDFNSNFILDQILPLTETSSDTLSYSLDEPEVTTTVSFLYMDADPNFSLNSTKFGRDVNGDIAESDDLIEYTLTITNNGLDRIENASVSDVVSGMITLDWDSFDCQGMACEEGFVTKTGQSGRPFMISGLSLDAGDTVTIMYSGTLSGMDAPTVQLMAAQDLDASTVDDDFLDIGATPKNNPSGRMIVFYSNGTTSENGLTKINYIKQTTAPAETPTVDPFADMGIDLSKDANNNGTPDDLEGSDDGPSESANDLYTGQTQGDDDGDGLSNLWDDYFGAVNDPRDLMANVGGGYKLAQDVGALVADGLETLMTQFLCSGGCIATPLNFAFLVPGPVNLMGVPILPMDMAHMPVFGAPVPGLPPIWPPMPFQGSTAVRLYVSLTLTLGFTTSVCVGPYMLGQCWSFAIPLFEFLGVCDAVNGAITDAISKASAFISKGKNKVMALAGDIPLSSSGGGGRNESGGLINYNLGEYAVASDASGKQRVEGYPKPFAKWLREQSEEVVNKLTDLPDIYLFYPDPKSIIGAFKPEQKIETADLRGLEKILAMVNSIPLIRIETSKVNFRFPALSADEIERFKIEGDQWLENLRNQWESKKKVWYESEQREIAEEIDKMIDSVEQNLETLEDYKDFPRELLQYRDAGAMYVKQIICYLDAIINEYGGWVAINKVRIDKWIKAFYDAKNALKDWKVIFDLAIDYQASCDQCKTAKLSLFELLAKLFVFVPSPPIITLPRWPDIVFDLSQIQAGLTVLWPELNFVPEPLLLPTLPQITIPDIPTASIELPTIPLLPALPDLPTLPMLPGIPVPNLPTLPPPPEIPSLPQSVSVSLEIGKSIMKIICLIQSGIIPVSETTLKTHVEQITQRPLNPVLPLDLTAGFKVPPLGIDFVDRIEVITYLNLGLNFEGILNVVEKAAEETNELVTDLVELANQGMQIPSDITEDVLNAPADALNDVEVEIDLESFLPSVSEDALYTQEALNLLNNPYLQPYLSQWNDHVDRMQIWADEQKELSAAVPEVYELKATSDFLAYSPAEVDTHFETIQDHYSRDQLSTLEDSDLDELRDDLLSYLDTNTAQTDHLASLINGSSTDWDDLNRWIASTQDVASPLERSSNSHVVLASEDPSDSTPEEDWASLQDWLTSALASDENPLAESTESLHAAKDRYLVQTDSSNDATSGSSNASTVNNTGLFLYNEETETNERLMHYTGEVDAESSHLLFLDIENDDDDDIVYAYDGNVYLKENFTETESLDHVTKSPSTYELSDWLPKAPVVDLYRSIASNNGSASVAWREGNPHSGDQDMASLLGYELRALNSLMAFEEDQPDWVHWAHLMVDAVPQTIDLISVETLAPGSSLSTENGQTEKLLYDEASIEVEENSRLFLPALEKPLMRVRSLEGDAELPENAVKRIRVKASGALEVEPGETIHSLRDSVIHLTLADESEFRIELSDNILYPLSVLYSGAIDLRVLSGEVEVFGSKSSSEPQSIYPGMILFEDETVAFDDDFTIEYNSTLGHMETTYGGTVSYAWKRLSNAEEPSMDLVLENGDYYSTLRSILSDGARGTWGSIAHLGPQICADNEAPYPNVGGANQTVSVYKTLTLDGSSSFDTSSSIVRYTWDTDLSSDRDGDGDPTNDVDYFQDSDPLTDADGDGSATNDRDDPTLLVGPYDSLETRDFKLWIGDEAGNTSGTPASVEVFVPDIHLNSAAEASGVVEGYIDPAESDIPFVLARERDGVFSLITTPSADENGNYTTDESGEFEVDDLDFSEQWIVYNIDHEPVATIDPETGEITITDDDYHTEVYSAELPWPTRVALVDSYGTALVYIFLVPDANVDLQLDDSSLVYDASTTKDMVGVHVKLDALPETLHLEFIPANDPLFTGGMAIVDNNEQRWAVIDTDGNIYRLMDLDLTVLDAASVNETADVEGADPIVIRLGDAGTSWLQIYIATNEATDLYFQETTALGLESTTGETSTSGADSGSSSTTGDDSVQTLDNKDSDSDGLSDLDELRAGLDPYDPSDANEDADSDGLTNAEEGAVDTNINQSDTDGDGASDYEEVQGGSDPLDPEDSYFEDLSITDSLYSDILNLVQLGVIEGYEESDGIYFHPDEFISRAEFTKILLGILCITPRPEAYEAPAVFNDIPFSDDLPWYYAITKESFLQNFIYGYLGEVDENGLTPFKPDISISRAEGAKIILEALNTLGVIDISSVEPGEPWYAPYMEIAQDLNPYLVGETGGDGETYILTEEEAELYSEALTRYDFVEMSMRVLDVVNCYAEQDSDGDGLSDYDEVSVYGTDPYEADTDGGGISDGDEINSNTNPLDQNDDDTDGDELTDSDETDLFGTDPYEADTDGGGVNDGTEVVNGTNPVNVPEDDFSSDADEGDESSTVPSEEITEEELEETVLEEENATDELEPGIYIITNTCVSCPCGVTLENSADLLPGDTLFAAIMDALNEVVLSISEGLEIK